MIDAPKPLFFHNHHAKKRILGHQFRLHANKRLQLSICALVIIACFDIAVMYYFLIQTALKKFDLSINNININKNFTKFVTKWTYIMACVTIPKTVLLLICL